MSKLPVAAQAFLKLLLAGGGLFGAMELFRLVLLPELQSAFQLDATATSVVRRVGILLSVLLAYWAYVRLIEGRRVHELYFAPASIANGVLSGVVLISITSVSLFALGIYEVTAVRGLQSGLQGVAGLIFVAAMLEEIAFRGVLFQILESAWGTVPALWVQSFIFAVLHLANIEDVASHQEMITTVVSGTLIGAFWTVMFVYSRNLWVVGTHHAAWNFSIILTGLPLSGIETWRTVAPLESRYNGPPWLTGGVFGPEDSVITIVVVAIGIAVLFYLARENGRLINPAMRRAD
ncbi:MAG: type II CAAX endopeptidase family protein [Micropepsaceae bacterium]